MTIKIVCFLLIAAALILLFAVNVFSGPTLYRIKIDASDLSGVDVEIVSHPEERTVRIAMAAHPEYDDRYFRYVQNFTAESNGNKIAFTKPEEAIWQLDDVAGQLTIRYRVAFVPKEREWRQSWKPHLSLTGGMVGDLHTLMYIVGQEKHPALLALDMPVGWKAVSGLEPTDDPRRFLGTVELLLDSPVLVGDVKEWKFTAGGVPHTVAIWSPKDEKPVDPKPVVEQIQRLTEQAIRAFGPPPYPRYSFLIENGGQAALEHATSLNVGWISDLPDMLQHIAHEYVHVWNLMDVRPRERVGLKHKFAEPTGVLWFSEGATIMFADLLLRRVGILGDGRTRIQRLEWLIARYLSSPAYSTLSAELVSRGDSHPELLKDSWAGTHLQGEVISNMLDLKIRDATGGRGDLTGTMKFLAAKFDSSRGITNDDLHEAFVKTCGCEITDFFKAHITGAKQLDFDRYLGLIGLRAEITWKTATSPDGSPIVDLRINPMSPEGEMVIRIINTKSAWAKAGLKTGDKVESAGGRKIANWDEFRDWLRTLKVGDTARLNVTRGGVQKTVAVPIEPYEIPSVRLIERSDATEKHVKLRKEWLNSHIRPSMGSANWASQ